MEKIKAHEGTKDKTCPHCHTIGPAMLWRENDTPSFRGLWPVCQRGADAEFVANEEITALRLFVPAFHCSTCSRLMSSGLKNSVCGMENMAICSSPGCEGRLMDQATIRITRGHDWEVFPHPCELFQIPSRVQGSQGAINTELDHTYYVKYGKCFTISKPNKTPSGKKYTDYNEIVSFEVPKRAMSPDREFVGPEKVIVLEQHHYAKRGALDQGGRGPRHRGSAPDREILLTGTHHTQTSAGVLPQAVEPTSGGHRQGEERTQQVCNRYHVLKMTMSQVLLRLIHCLSHVTGNSLRQTSIRQRIPLIVHHRVER